MAIKMPQGHFRDRKKRGLMLLRYHYKPHKKEILCFVDTFYTKRAMSRGYGYI